MNSFNIMLKDLGLNDINPRICGWENCEPNHSYGPASRSYFLLHYVRSGRGVFEREGKTYPVTKGEVFVIRPGEMTTYRADANDPWKYSWLGFDVGIKLPICLSKPVVNAKGCEHIFRSLLHYKDGEGSNELYICGKIYELLGILGKQKESNHSPTNRYVNKAKNYINSSYMERISVEQMARQLGLDRSYFCRIFKSIEGVSPMEYLVTLRLQRAAELIAERGYTPSEAAASCGYTDTVNFSRMFKRYFKIPPSKYGKMHVKKSK